ncbi:MAG: GbsR/MarR family transcriptional regulator [Anaerolineae bacterium]
MDQLERIKEQFILHWGEMGPRWGINRTMAQVQALLFISPEPLSAEEIMNELQISRGNVSMTLRELIDWGIVYKVHLKGERREYFTSEKDVWELFRTIARERKKREVDPTVRLLKESVAALQSLPDSEGQYEREQLESLLDFFETGASIYDELQVLSPSSLLSLASYGLKLKGKNE